MTFVIYQHVSPSPIMYFLYSPHSYTTTTNRFNNTINSLLNINCHTKKPEIKQITVSTAEERKSVRPSMNWC